MTSHFTHKTGNKRLRRMMAWILQRHLDCFPIPLTTPKRLTQRLILLQVHAFWLLVVSALLLRFHPTPMIHAQSKVCQLLDNRDFSNDSYAADRTNLSSPAPDFNPPVRQDARTTPGFPPFEEAKRQQYLMDDPRLAERAFHANGDNAIFLDPGLGYDAGNAGFAGNKGSRFAKFFVEGKNKEPSPPMNKVQPPIGAPPNGPSPIQRHEQAGFRNASSNSNDPRSMEDIFAMLNNSVQVSSHHPYYFTACSRFVGSTYCPTPIESSRHFITSIPTQPTYTTLTRTTSIPSALSAFPPAATAQRGPIGGPVRDPAGRPKLCPRWHGARSSPCTT